MTILNIRSGVKVYGVSVDGIFTTTQRDALQSVVNGSKIYNVTEEKFQFYENGTWKDKQDTLISGTNIKTINSTSLLGAGDISISGATNLAVANNTATNLDVTSDTGTDATLPQATITTAGLLSASDKVLVDDITNKADKVLNILEVADLPTGGDIGLAPATVDGFERFDVTQTTAGQTITLPSPTLGTNQKTVYIANTGTVSFTVYGVDLEPNKHIALLYDTTQGWLIASGGGSVNVLIGATGITNGVEGLVPQPLAGDENKYLKGDGTWQEVAGGGGITYNDFIGATPTLAGANGLVPQPQAGEEEFFLSGGGTWQPVDTVLPFFKDILIGDWVLNGELYEIVITALEHTISNNIFNVVLLEEVSLNNFVKHEAHEIIINQSSGQVTVQVTALPDLRVNGKIHITGGAGLGSGSGTTLVVPNPATVGQNTSDFYGFNTDGFNLYITTGEVSYLDTDYEQVDIYPVGTTFMMVDGNLQIILL